jgi:predicted unusual protein kinase regulating ubiquinone biosynthesis (AarF/ABC1/UbiB family)
MRGAAMKVGQLFSMIALDGLPEAQRDELQAKLATLRDDVPPVPLKRGDNRLHAAGQALRSALKAHLEAEATAAAAVRAHRLLAA